MNDKDWADNPEFWDEEEHGDDDDDEYNGLGDDVDANNDETFDNAAEWNEDEHEELIARDMILSHKPSSQPRQPEIHQKTPNQQPIAQQSRPPITVEELERQLMKTSINQHAAQQPQVMKLQPETSRRAGWSPFGGKDLFTRDDDDGDDPISLSTTSLLEKSIWTQRVDPDRMTLEEQRRLIQLQQQRLMLQEQQILQQQQQQQHIQQQHQNQGRRSNQQTQHYALFACAVESPLQTMSRAAPTTTRGITVEELERQMMANRSNNLIQQASEIKLMNKNIPENLDKSLRNSERIRYTDDHRHRTIHEKRNGERHDRFERFNRETNDHRDNYRDRRETRNQRDGHRLHRREPVIIPPQVQLNVINRAKRRHNVTAKHHDEFIRDRMPSSGEGFRFLRHSQVDGAKVKHDGVLTDKERAWLIRIQEKIQADYDNDFDQDYYYLLYFNRSSMTDEAAQRPMGHGVQDRRFIPRERLLYNSGV